MAVIYQVVYSERAEDDRDRLVFSLLGYDIRYAEQWSVGLAEAVLALTTFPGPLACARDEEASDLFGREVRRLLYYGPTRRKSGTPVRILFTLCPPPEGEDDDPTVILLLRLLRGGQSLVPPSDL